MEQPSFDDWKTLFEEDPELFEQKRQDFLTDYIVNHWPDDPESQQRAQAILWRMEQNYRHIKDPIERFNQVVVQFWQQVNKFKNALDQLR